MSNLDERSQLDLEEKLHPFVPMWRIKQEVDKINEPKIAEFLAGLDCPYPVEYLDKCIKELKATYDLLIKDPDPTDPHFSDHHKTHIYLLGWQSFRTERYVPDTTVKWPDDYYYYDYDDSDYDLNEHNEIVWKTGKAEGPPIFDSWRTFPLFIQGYADAEMLAFIEKKEKELSNVPDTRLSPTTALFKPPLEFKLPDKFPSFFNNADDVHNSKSPDQRIKQIHTLFSKAAELINNQRKVDFTNAIHEVPLPENYRSEVLYQNFHLVRFYQNNLNSGDNPTAWIYPKEYYMQGYQLAVEGKDGYIDHLFDNRTLQKLEGGAVIIDASATLLINNSNKSFLEAVIRGYADVMFQSFVLNFTIFKSHSPILNTDNIFDPIDEIFLKNGQKVPGFKFEAQEAIFNFLADYFDKEDAEALKSIIFKSEFSPQKLVFKGEGNKLTDTFVKLIDAKYIVGFRLIHLNDWIYSQFKYVIDGQPKDFKVSSIRKVTGRSQQCKNPILGGVGQILSGEISIDFK